jgi:hypothetical protein
MHAAAAAGSPGGGTRAALLPALCLPLPLLLLHASRGLMGLASAAAMPCVTATSAQLVPAAQRASAVAGAYAAFNIGTWPWGRARMRACVRDGGVQRAGGRLHAAATRAAVRAGSSWRAWSHVRCSPPCCCLHRACVPLHAHAGGVLGLVAIPPLALAVGLPGTFALTGNEARAWRLLAALSDAVCTHAVVHTTTNTAPDHTHTHHLLRQVLLAWCGRFGAPQPCPAVAGGQQ